METVRYNYIVGYVVPKAGRAGSVSVQAENIQQARERALALVTEKTNLNGPVIIPSIRCEGRAK